MVGGEGLRIRIANGLAVEGFGEQELGSRKARIALKSLAIARGRPVSPERLTAAIWGEEPPRDISAQLAVLMSRLRRVIGGDRITRSDSGYALRADWIDITAAESMLEESRRALHANEPQAALVAAVSARDLLAHLTLDDVIWPDAERGDAERLQSATRLQVARAALAAGEPTLAVAAAQQAVDADVYDEEALRLAMTGMAAQSRTSMALALYESFRQRLADELGVSPSPETDAAHRALLKGLPVPGITVSTWYEASPQSDTEIIVGRDDELHALDSLFASAQASGPAVVVIEGEPGIGKSALASRWIERRDTGTQVLAARCDQLSRALPLQPVLHLLRAYLRQVSADDARRLLGPDAVFLGPLLDESSLPSATPFDPAAPFASSPAGIAVLTAALRRVVARVAARPTVLFVDDVQRADAVSIAWLADLADMRPLPLLIVLTRRQGEGDVPATARRVALRPLTLDDARALVGEERAAALLARSGGNPLFLQQLARSSGDDLPPSIQALAVSRREEAGEAAETLQVAALLGATVDVDVLAAVTRRDPVSLLRDLDIGSRLSLLDEREGSYVFRHEILREALENTLTTPRRSLVHREAARVLATRPSAGPMDVAHHARLSGANSIASAALVQASRLAAERFDYAQAERLADEALAADDTGDARLQRAIVHLRQARYADSQRDAEEAVRRSDAPQALEVAGAVAYYCRDFDRAAALGAALQQQVAAPEQRLQGMVIQTRALHARGDVADARELMSRALRLCEEHQLRRPESVHAFLQVHCGEARAAADALRNSPYATQESASTIYTPAHAYTILGYALATVGEAGDALRVLERASAEAQRRGLTRYISLGANMSSWVLRNIGEVQRAREHNDFAASAARNVGYRELEVYARLDPCDDAIAADDAAAAERCIASARTLMGEPYAYRWRHELRVTLLEGRIALLRGRRDAAASHAESVTDASRRYRARRYESLATVLLMQGVGTVPGEDELQRLSTSLGSVAALEAWRLFGELAVAAGSARCEAFAQHHRKSLAATLEQPQRDSFLAYSATTLERIRTRGRTG